METWGQRRSGNGTDRGPRVGHNRSPGRPDCGTAGGGAEAAASRPRETGHGDPELVVDSDPSRSLLQRGWKVGQAHPRQCVQSAT
jgi:hypothetical protein